MKNLKSIIVSLVILMVLKNTASIGQDLSWIQNTGFELVSAQRLAQTGSSTINTVRSAEMIPNGVNGNVQLNGFQIANNNISEGVNPLAGTILLSLLPNGGNTGELGVISSYHIKLTGHSGPVIPDGESPYHIEVKSPNGVVHNQDIPHPSANMSLGIVKNGSNMSFIYAGTTVVSINNIMATDYRLVISSTINEVAFDYQYNGFEITTNSFPPPSVTDTDRNWTSVKTYNPMGTLTGASVAYFDELGRGTQAQTKDILTGRNWATETRYDREGRPALSTFGAPINSDHDFSYKEQFITTFSDTPGEFLNSFFEGLENPGVVGEHEGSLGWYYSELNTDEPHQDFTRRPYTMTLYDELNPGTARAVISGNSVDVNGNGNNDGLLDTYPQGFSYSMPASQELYYAFGQEQFPENRSGWFSAMGIAPFNTPLRMLTHRATKSVVIDAHGNENIVLTDLEGKTLAAARSGGDTEYPVISTIGEQGFVDVHLPKGTTNADISFIGGHTGYSAWDLRSGQQVSLGNMTGGHVYRIVYNAPVSADKTIVLLDNNGLLQTRSGAKGISYKVNYYDFALNYYNEAGNILESVQPLGFDDSNLVAGNPSATPSHTHISGYAYNSLGQLLNTSSPDEGEAHFVYRDDGQIRFSQNSKQLANDEYSYTNYDAYARPIESGVCGGDLPASFSGGNPEVTTINLVANTPGYVAITADLVQKINDEGPTGLARWAQGGFYSSEAISGDFRVSFETSGNHVMLGLTQSGQHTSDDYRVIDYTIYVPGGTVQVRENNSMKTGNLGGATNATFAIQRIGTTITYWKNDDLLYTNNNATDLPLHLDGRILLLNSRIFNLSVESLETNSKDSSQQSSEKPTLTGESSELTISGGNVTKIAANSFYDGRFSSQENYEGDFQLSFSVTGKNIFLGLSPEKGTEKWQQIDYAFQTDSKGTLVVYSDGVIQASNLAIVKDGDQLNIRRHNNEVIYSLNKKELYTMPVIDNRSLKIYGGLYAKQSRLSNIEIIRLNQQNVKNPGQFFDVPTSLCSEQTFTLYDIPDQEGLNDAMGGGSGPSRERRQQWLSGNVSKTWTQNPSTNTTWYSYDVYGRVKWMVQQIEGLGTKTIDYIYDPVTGEVTQINYNGGGDDRFTHRYTYNEIGQLTKVETKRDNQAYKEEANYVYYETGALKRVVLGDNVQGIDYVYNLQGALKSINHPDLTAANDPGGDVNDVFGMIIDYHNRDYLRNGHAAATSQSGDNRFDGNIKGIRWNTRIGNTVEPPNAYLYTYDKNLWLKEANFGTANNAGGITLNSQSDYKVSNLNYDPNGNIQSLRRNRDTRPGILGNGMDNFSYHYSPGTNQLNYVADAITIDTDAEDLEGQAANNYVYNNIGQLIFNTKDGVTYTYNTSGLVTEVAYQPTTGDGQSIQIQYDDRGHRVHKQFTTGSTTTQSYYVRDASGQPLAIYGIDVNGETKVEYPVYGASRLGINYDWGTNYEVTDHLGNVRAVVQGVTQPITLIFEDQFNDGNLDGWIFNPNSAFIESDQLHLKMNTATPQIDVIRLELNLTAEHEYSVRSYLKLLDVEDEVKIGIRKVSDGSDNQVKTWDISLGNFPSANFIAASTDTYYLYIRSSSGSIVPVANTYRAIFDNLKVADLGIPNPLENEQLLAYKDYYPGGMAMPNRNVESNYRYGYQGEFAETDKETGKVAFEHRLYDPRINRWLIPDRVGEFHSPYLAMGNNWINYVDVKGDSTQLVNRAGELIATVDDGNDYYTTRFETVVGQRQVGNFENGYRFEDVYGYKEVSVDGNWIGTKGDYLNYVGALAISIGFSPNTPIVFRNKKTDGLAFGYRGASTSATGFDAVALKPDKWKLFANDYDRSQVTLLKSYWNTVNALEHELFHNAQAFAIRFLGGSMNFDSKDAFKSWSEKSAIDHQKSLHSWNRATSAFRDGINNYRATF